METGPPPYLEPAALQLRLLGPLTLQRAGETLVLPPSRKVRALVAYLALATHPVSRSHLCGLLWEQPNDPRGELRWCLSKARALLDEPGRPRVLADTDRVQLDRSDIGIDVRQLDSAVQAGLDTLDLGRLRALAALFGGDFLQDLEIDRSASFSAWLTGERRRLRALQIALLERLVRASDGEAAQTPLAQWLQLAPFDLRAHTQLFETLARRGRLREGDLHLAGSALVFEAEGQDWAPLAHAWRAAKSRPALPAVAAAREAAPPVAMAARRASIAIMPFADTQASVRGGLADGLAHDLITRLAKLRSMFVIAQGSVFALDERGLGAEAAGHALGVDYVAGGTLQREGGRLHVNVQLAETRSGRVVWADRLSAPLGETLAMLDTIGDRIVSAIASQVEVAERNRAILKAPEGLDAWEAHHRGLWHMYRFHREDNNEARRWFETAVQLDPGFSRPYAGLSFTHFQNAFLGWGDREREIELAYRRAAEGLQADEQDPASHWAYGRALWLRGRLDASVAELGASVSLSPNFALGHYTLAFVQAQSGDAGAAIVSSDHARELSPFDPLLFAMLATRAMALMRLGRHDEAADWALKAAARPNAHLHILGIAAHCLALAGRHAEARAVAATIRQQAPGYGTEDFLAAFRFADDGEALIRRAAMHIAAI